MAAVSKRQIVPGPYRIPKMRSEFNPEIAGEPVSTYELEVCSAQIAIADNGIIAITDFQGTIHLYDKQYHPLHTFTCCDDEMDHDDFEDDSMPTQMVFDAHGNILLAVMLYRDKQGGLLRFNTNGKRLPEMSVPEVVQGRLAEEHGSYFNVTGVTRDPHGNVFFRLIHILSDRSATRVYICKQTNGSGAPTLLSDDIFGQYDDDDDVEDVGHYVNQLAYGPNDHLYVVSPDGIQEFDSISGHKLQTISLEALPVGVDVVHRARVCFSLTVSGDGYIFVVVLGTPDVYVFSLDGSYLCKLSTPSSVSAGATAIDRDGFLHVLDPANGRVYVF